MASFGQLQQVFGDDVNARDAELCVFSDHRQKESDSGNVREHAPVRVSHVPNVDFRAFAKQVQNVFRSLLCFLNKEHLRTHRHELETMLTTDTSCVRPTCFTDVDEPRASTSSLL